MKFESRTSDDDEKIIVGVPNSENGQFNADLGKAGTYVFKELEIQDVDPIIAESIHKGKEVSESSLIFPDPTFAGIRKFKECNGQVTKKGKKQKNKSTFIVDEVTELEPTKSASDLAEFIMGAARSSIRELITKR